MPITYKYHTSGGQPQVSCSFLNILSTYCTDTLLKFNIEHLRIIVAQSSHNETAHIMAQPPLMTSATASGSADSDKVTLDVAGRKFITLAATLEESDFLRTLVSEPWRHNRQAEGSYFVDANPDTFGDIIDYLRRGWMPLFWDRETGHDFHRYKKLQLEAGYLGIPRLEHWLSESKFLEAVVITKESPTRSYLRSRKLTFRLALGVSAKVSRKIGGR